MLNLLVPLVLAAPVPQVCPSDPAGEIVGLSTVGSAGLPRLELGGAPLIGHPVQAEVTHSLPGAPGAIFLSTAAAPVALPAFGATFHPAPPLFPTAFAVGPDGTSPPLLALGSTPPSFCGLEVLLQAVVLDPGAAGGVAFTHAARLEFGGAQGAPLLPGLVIEPAGSPSEPFLGDLDGDLVADLVVLDALDDVLRVFPGLGGGSFGLEQTLDPQLSSVASFGVGDLNLDGHADVVAWGSGLSVLLAAGDGSFAPPLKSPLLLGALGELHDVDADGLLDLAVLGGVAQTTITVYPGLGGGAFGPGLVTPLAGFAIVADVAFGHLDGDGTLDFVYGHQKKLRLVRGAGDGTFVEDPPLGLSGDALILRFARADLNGDAAADLCVLTAPNEVVTLLGGGDGSFAEADSETVAGGFLTSVTDIAAGDLDGDGWDEVLVTDGFPSGKTVYVLPGLGDGTLGAQAAFLTGEGPDELLIGHADGDGDLDAVVVNGMSRDVAVLFGPGDGTLIAARPVEGLFGAVDVAVGDLDGDLVPELVVAGAGTDAIAVAPGLGQAQYGPPSSFPTGADPQAIVLVDLDGDHALDALTANRGSGDLSVLLGLGDGTFAPAQPWPAGGAPRALVAADLDGDGAADVAVGLQAPGTAAVLLGAGDGSLGAPAPLPLGAAVEDGLAAADLNLDGTLDLVATQASGGGVVWLPGAGDGTFGAPQPIAPTSGALAVADLGADGLPDVAVGYESGFAQGRIDLYTGLGAGLFAETQTLALDRTPSDLALADLDGDLVVDLASISSDGDGSRVDLFPGLGDGSLGAETAFLAPGESLALGDLDGDLVPDLAVGSLELGALVLSSRLLE